MGEASLWRLKIYGSWLAGCVGVVLAYLSGFELVTRYVSSLDARHLAANLFVVAFAFIAVSVSVWRQWITIRKERYADIFPLVHQLFHQIRDLTTYASHHQPKEGDTEELKKFLSDYRVVLGRILDQLKSIFVLVTGAQCRAVIKLTYPKPPELFLYALTRDQGSKQRCLRSDTERAQKDHDRLEDNPHYKRLFDEGEDVWYYFSNDLPRVKGFQSTSVTAYKPDFDKHPTPERQRWWWPWTLKWPLPYKSKIACVIRQPPFDMDPDSQTEVLGLLILDSEAKGIFDERWDVQLMFAVADMLYIPLRIYVNIQNKADRSKKHGTIGTK